MKSEASCAAIDKVARESYGRLIAYLSSDTGDISQAEDLLSEAFQKALETWPQNGVPDKPEAWLLKVARRKLIDWIRKREVQSRYLEKLEESYSSESFETMEIEDRRLGLMFACAHPDIDSSIHTPLILNVVLGLTAKQIASAFLVKPETMGQRLSRAKAQIKESDITFEIPEIEKLPERLNSVAEAIYCAYGIGWEWVPGSDSQATDVAEEALWLAEYLAKTLPGESEALALHSMLLYIESRKEARIVDGYFVPLEQQDTALWNLEMIEWADQKLHAAATNRSLGNSNSLPVFNRRTANEFELQS